MYVWNLGAKVQVLYSHLFTLTVYLAMVATYTHIYIYTYTYIHTYVYRHMYIYTKEVEKGLDRNRLRTPVSQHN